MKDPEFQLNVGSRVCHYPLLLVLEFGLAAVCLSVVGGFGDPGAVTFHVACRLSFYSCRILVYFGSVATLRGMIWEAGEATGLERPRCC